MSEEQHVSDRILSQGQGDRFDRWVEFFGALVLGFATIATAWSAYQATLWGGDESKFYFQATNAQLESADLEARAMQRSTIQVALFLDYASAISEGNQELADFVYARFPPELHIATDAWLATNPLTNADAPTSPFFMPEYHLSEYDDALAQDQLYVQKSADAALADGYGDRYVMMTVIFASALFFAGIAGKFQWRVIDGAMLALAFIVLLVGLVLVLQIPVN